MTGWYDEEGNYFYEQSSDGYIRPEVRHYAWMCEERRRAWARHRWVGRMLLALTVIFMATGAVLVLTARSAIVYALLAGALVLLLNGWRLHGHTLRVTWGLHYAVDTYAATLMDEGEDPHVLDDALSGKIKGERMWL